MYYLFIYLLLQRLYWESVSPYETMAVITLLYMRDVIEYSMAARFPISVFPQIRLYLREYSIWIIVFTHVFTIKQSTSTTMASISRCSRFSRYVWGLVFIAQRLLEYCSILLWDAWQCTIAKMHLNNTNFIEYSYSSTTTKKLFILILEFYFFYIHTWNCYIISLWCSDTRNWGSI